jgi:hypothetical protein
MSLSTKPPSSGSAETRAARGKIYGTAREDFTRIANLWNALLDTRLKKTMKLDAADVAQMMRMVKESRLVKAPDHYDSLLDICGYADLQYEVSLEVSSPVPIETDVKKNLDGSYSRATPEVKPISGFLRNFGKDNK